MCKFKLWMETVYLIHCLSLSRMLPSCPFPVTSWDPENIKLNHFGHNPGQPAIWFALSLASF